MLLDVIVSIAGPLSYGSRFFFPDWDMFVEKAPWILTWVSIGLVAFALRRLVVLLTRPHLRFREGYRFRSKTSDAAFSLFLRLDNDGSVLATVQAGTADPVTAKQSVGTFVTGSGSVLRPALAKFLSAHVPAAPGPARRKKTD